MFEIEWCGHISHVIAQGRCASNTGGKKTHQKKKTPERPLETVISTYVRHFTLITQHVTVFVASVQLFTDKLLVWQAILTRVH